jgi:protein TonB
MQHTPSHSLPPIVETARQLARPLALSLFLHALLIWNDAPNTSAPPSGNPPLLARLHQPAAAPAKIETPPSVASDTPKEAEDPSPTRPPTERSYPSQTAETASSPSEMTTQEGISTAPPAPITSASLYEYHLAISRAARQFRRYPEAALQAGWQGRVVIRLTVAADGTPHKLQLIGSSGHNVLDEAALEMLYLAAGHTQAPTSLQGRSFDIDLAINFNPEEFKADNPTGLPN